MPKLFLIRPISLTSLGLKSIASLTMLADHVGFLFFPDDLLWRVVGRMSFPLFAFLIAEGFEKTSNCNNYFRRLLIFAAISQIPYLLFRYGADGNLSSLNIFFTLAAGLVALACSKHLPLRLSFPAIVGIAGLAEALSFDYGAYGVITVLASRLIIHRRSVGLTTSLLLPQIVTLVDFIRESFSIQSFASLGTPLIALYNGKRGAHLPRFVFYLFYPVHLFLLWLIWFLFR